MTDEPELYVPRPGTLPWRVLNYLLQNPDEELTRGDVAVKFSCIGTGIDTMLQLAVARECLKKSRNSKGEMIWILGLVKRFRLDQLPPDTAKPSAPVATPVPPAKPYQAIQAVKLPGPVEVKVDAPYPPVAPPVCSPVAVLMPLHLTPELIKAVVENPKTSFESKADGHHAIGWLHDAYQVMVEAQTNVPRKKVMA